MEMNGKNYIDYRTVCRLPEEIVEKIQKDNKKKSGLDYTGIIKNTLLKMKQGSLDQYIKWQEDLLDEERQSILKRFMIYGIRSTDIIAVYRRSMDEICLFTEKWIYIGQTKQYEFHYFSIPIDKIQKIDNRSYDGPIVYFEDGNFYILKNFEYKNTVLSFLQRYIKELATEKRKFGIK